MSLTALDDPMTTGYQNRIVGHDTVAPDQLLANDRNWRTHPQAQQSALDAALADVGWVQSVISNVRTGRLIDGHLRVMLAMRNDEPTIPVTYVDLSEDEEALVLATLDPIGALAGADTAQLDALLREVDTGQAALQELLADLATEHGVTSGSALAPEAFPSFDDDLDTEHRCPKCGYEWSGKSA